MSRVSGDQWKLANGELVVTAPGDKPSDDAVLVNGYDYENQHWVINGEKKPN